MLSAKPIHSDPTQSILIVEDNEVILELLSEGFKRYGFMVYQAENGLEGWRLFNDKQIDVVLTDIRMPGLDGSELSHRIRNQSPYIKIAVMTGGDGGVATGLLENGTANYFFSKPFDLKNICTSLMRAAQTA